MTETVLSAALAGVPAGMQAQGVWAGRRQLFVRFAGEAETATMYSSAALAREIQRQLPRAAFHSISISGRDPLANLPFLLAVLQEATPPVPVMLDTDGQRPEAIAPLAPFLSLIQVTIDFEGPQTTLSRAMETIAAAHAAARAHALVLCPRDDTSDGLVLRAVEHLHTLSVGAEVVLHPPLPKGEPPALDRRWAVLLERAVAAHGGTRLALRIPPPSGLR